MYSKLTSEQREQIVQEALRARRSGATCLSLTR